MKEILRKKKSVYFPAEVLENIKGNVNAFIEVATIYCLLEMKRGNKEFIKNMQALKEARDQSIYNRSKFIID